MKKTILLSGILATGVALADATVESGNAAGALDLTINNSAEQVLVSVPFPGGPDNSPVLVKDVVKTGNLADGSKIYAPTGNGGYNTWKLNDNVWVADKTVTIGADGKPLEGESTSQEEATLLRGDAFWIQPIFKDSAASGKIVLFGEGEATPGTSAFSAGWNLLGNASTAEVSLKDLTSGELDQIIVQIDGKLRYYTYKSAKGGWRYQKGTKWSDPAIDPLKIVPGQGFWYKSTAGGKSIDWADGTAK